MPRIEFETTQKLDRHLEAGRSLQGAVFQGLDLSAHSDVLLSQDLEDALFLGCILEPETLEYVSQHDALVFPRIPNVPYNIYRGLLYSPDELMGNYRPGIPGSYTETLDGRIYQHFLDTGRAHPTCIVETVARRLHDHAVTDAMEELIEGRHVAGIMGGHSMLRSHPSYIELARIARTLARRGFLMTSGGGPGAMEATHLGVWFMNRSDDELIDAVQMLSAAPHYKPQEAWLDAAFAVTKKYPLLPDTKGQWPVSLGIPTWHYGHEPPTIFATHIAKYFANSIREDGLLTIATCGLVIAPGSAGTIQEIFQDATQNHYNTVGIVSPMIFFGKQFWTKEKPIYPLLRQLAAGRAYADLIAITDDPAQVVQRIESFAATLDA